MPNPSPAPLNPTAQPGPTRPDSASLGPRGYSQLGFSDCRRRPYSAPPTRLYWASLGPTRLPTPTRLHLPSRSTHSALRTGSGLKLKVSNLDVRE